LRYERRRSAPGRRGSTLPLHTRSGLRDSDSDAEPDGVANSHTGYPNSNSDSHTDSDPGDANSNTGNPDTDSHTDSHTERFAELRTELVVWS
jgi:hypothetical protein